MTASCGKEGASLHLSLAVVPASSVASALTAATLRSAATNVAATTSGLTSLKLYITTVQICNGITMNGTALSNSSGCLVLYSGPSGNDALRSTTDLAGALAAAPSVTTGYIDVMSDASRAILNQNIIVGSGDARDYNYGVISWAPPIKVTGTLVDASTPGTPVLYTKASRPGMCVVNNMTPYPCARATSAMTATPAQESIFAAGADVVFKFQKPFTITTADVTNKAQYALKLAFNPDGLLQGVVAPGATNFPPIGDGVGTNSINDVGSTMALVDAQIAPIFYQAASQVMRESYSTVLSQPMGGSFKLRLELYSLSSDSTHAIYGVNAATLPTNATTGYLVGFTHIYGTKTNSDGSVNLLDYQGAGRVLNFARLTTVGATTTAQLACDPVTMDCPAGSTLNATFTLDALAALP